MAAEDSSMLPAHASPALGPVREHSNGVVDELVPHRKALAALNAGGNMGGGHERRSGGRDGDERHHGNATGCDPPAALVSPAFTPPSTPGTGTPALDREAPSHVVDMAARSLAALSAPRLMDELPWVNCIVRARIPTTTGQEMYLHLYENSIDNKEHLAIVFGSRIRSRSLDAPRPGESHQDRMIRGAYTGRLFPGRQSSGFDITATKPSSLLRAASVNASAHRMQNAVDLTSFETGLGISSDAATPSAATRTPIPTSSPTDDTTNSNDIIPSVPRYASISESRPLVRIHSECYTGETVWSARCDCGEQLDEAARLMSLPSAAAWGGVIIYLRQEGRGIGLSEKLKAYNLQDLGSDTVEANLLLRHPADARSYGLATSMLVDLGLGQDALGVGNGIRLLTNNPDKIRAVEGPHQEVLVKERVEMVPLSWKNDGRRGVDSAEIRKYLDTKIQRMGHMLPKDHPQAP